jgi:hypothetical protein
MCEDREATRESPVEHRAQRGLCDADQPGDNHRRGSEAGAKAAAHLPRRRGRIRRASMTGNSAGGCGARRRKLEVS